MNDKLISFCIATAKNEKHYLELLLNSLKINLYNKNHEIIIFIDSDNQNTENWLLTQKSHFKDIIIIKNTCKIPIGSQINVTYMFAKAKHDIVCYLQSDMVISEHLDKHILDSINENTIVSITRIEPPVHPEAPEKIVKNFGTVPDEFNYNEFIAYSNSIKSPKITEFYFAPFALYKKKWLEIGGYDTWFRASREDTDILLRLSLLGVKFIQIWSTFVYHFTCVSSRCPQFWLEKNKEKEELRKTTDIIEVRKFLYKWKRFDHTTNAEKLYKYNVSANIKNSVSNPDFILDNYYLFEKIVVDNEQICDSLLKEFETQSLLYNLRAHIDISDWKKYSYLYRKDGGKFNKTPTSIENDDIILNLDLNMVDQNIYNNLSNLQDILHSSLNEGDTGEYELDGLNIKVNNFRNRICDNIYCKNPPIDLKFNIL
jgi:GT2 family glycosyltransferase